MGEEAMKRGVTDIFKGVFHFADSMLLKCAVELRIPDIIHSHGRAISASQIASAIDSPSVNIAYLERVMRMLVRMKIFTRTTDTSSGDILYGLTPSSMALLRDSEFSLVPFLLMHHHPMLISAWHYLSDCVKEGGSGYKKAHGCELFETASVNPEINKIFNDSMQSAAKMFGKAIATYEDGFKSIQSLVDVGGGFGHLIADIVKAFPHIKGINFDLPHVVATAPDHGGVSHVAGDMFNGVIPTADAIIMKNIMHDWGDEDCIKILKNCRRSLPEKTGKIMIVDLVLNADAEEGDELFGNLDLVLDILMMINHGAKERNELEFKKILQEAGFPRYKIIKTPLFVSIIEAYPE